MCSPRRALVQQRARGRNPFDSLHCSEALQFYHHLVSVLPWAQLAVAPTCPFIRANGPRRLCLGADGFHRHCERTTLGSSGDAGIDVPESLHFVFQAIPLLNKPCPLCLSLLHKNQAPKAAGLPSARLKFNTRGRTNLAYIPWSGSLGRGGRSGICLTIDRRDEDTDFHSSLMGASSESPQHGDLARAQGTCTFLLDTPLGECSATCCQPPCPILEIFSARMQAPILEGST